MKALLLSILVVSQFTMANPSKLDSGNILASGLYQNRENPENCHQITSSGNYSNWAVEMNYGHSCFDFTYSMTWSCAKSRCIAVAVNGHRVPKSAALKFFISSSGKKFIYESGTVFELFE